MYTVIRVNKFELKEFDENDIDSLLDYIDENLYSFPCKISTFDQSVRINDSTGYELYIINLTKLEIEYFQLKYTRYPRI